MAPAQSIFTLRKKISLTKDVFELHYTVETPLSYFPGQYIMFFLSSGLRRSYSIAWTDGTNFMFIIKRLENGGGGSKEICDSPLDTEMK